MISLPPGAIMMANYVRYMIMAGSNNPATGGIDQYAYVYHGDLGINPYNITFANHNRYNGGQPGRKFVFVAYRWFCRGSVERRKWNVWKYALGEALGITWGDSYPTGYGFYDKTMPYASFYKGPFFASVHSGSG